MISSKHGGDFDSETLKTSVSEIEALSAQANFWDNRENAEKKLSELKRLKARYEPWDVLIASLDDLKTLYELAQEEKDESLSDEIGCEFDKLAALFDKLNTMELLSEETDPLDAYVTIHSGAGGTEACDWAQMLYRMYSRYCERNNFTIKLIDMQEAEGGIKSVSITIEGDYAFGMLKGEGGIHRLVRISPFDSNARRHTSFASVYVSAAIDDTIEIDIKPDDIRIDTYRSSGAGGQHVNKTDSAIRITHLESNLVVQCQNERSQTKNKATAMKVLRSRLYEYYKQQQDEEAGKTAAEKKDIGWGSQIRSYVFHPYTMVKDLRTRAETGNIQAVMDGDLSQFIEKYLHWLRAEGTK